MISHHKLVTVCWFKTKSKKNKFWLFFFIKKFQKIHQNFCFVLIKIIFLVQHLLQTVWAQAETYISWKLWHSALQQKKIQPLLRESEWARVIWRYPISCKFHENLIIIHEKWYISWLNMQHSTKMNKNCPPQNLKKF
jgi:hypothetical protein